MKVKYLGHASFMLTSDSGTRIITDPYTPVNGLTYEEIKESADVVTVSHGHFDHNNARSVRGNPEVVTRTAKVKGIEFKGIPAYHDEARGSKRGNVTIFCFEVDGIRICHLSDLGHQLTDQQVADVGKVDILFIPVGGYYTIDAKGATQVYTRLQPKVVIPMHFKTAKGLAETAGVDNFLKGKTNVSRLDTSEIEFKSDKMPITTQIVVLKPAL